MENNSIAEIARQARRDYQNNWRSKNKDKVKRYNQRYWEKKATAIAVSENSEKNDDVRKD